MSSMSIVTGNREFVRQAAALLGEAFIADPKTIWLLSLPEREHAAYISKYMEVILTDVTMNGAAISQIGNWKSCGILMRSGIYPGNIWTAGPAGWAKVFWKLGWGGYHRMGVELTSGITACKKKALSDDEKYYYILILGTAKSARGQGLCSEIIRHYQDIASREGLPIWLEAGTLYCRKLYLRLGFVDVDEIKLGVGKVNEEGKLCEGGSGVTIWGMIWRPNLQSSN